MGGNERGGGVINPSLLMGENEGEEVFILSEPFGIYQFLGVSLVALGVGLLTLSPVTHK
jgi:hypothetical protein